MDLGTIVMIAIGVAAAIFVFVAYYWWEVRPSRQDDGEET
jgi:hypothetical protein